MANRIRKATGTDDKPRDGLDAAASGLGSVVGQGDSDRNTVNPATVAGSTGSVGASDGDNGGGDDGASQPKRGRGRPRGSGGASKTKPIPLNVNGLEKLLVGIHASLAFMSGRVEWALDTTAKDFDGATEAEFLSKSMKDVASHYNVNWLDQKGVDWANLIQCLVIVYGGRIYAIRQTRAVKTAAPKPATVAPSSGNGIAPEHRTGEVPGVGAVEFPASHPMVRGH